MVPAAQGPPALLGKGLWDGRVVAQTTADTSLPEPGGEQPVWWAPHPSPHRVQPAAPPPRLKWDIWIPGNLGRVGDGTVGWGAVLLTWASGCWPPNAGPGAPPPASGRPARQGALRLRAQHPAPACSCLHGSLGLPLSGPPLPCPAWQGLGWARPCAQLHPPSSPALRSPGLRAEAVRTDASCATGAERAAWGVGGRGRRSPSIPHVSTNNRGSGCLPAPRGSHPTGTAELRAPPSRGGPVPCGPHPSDWWPPDPGRPARLEPPGTAPLVRSAAAWASRGRLSGPSFRCGLGCRSCD